MEFKRFRHPDQRKILKKVSVRSVIATAATVASLCPTPSTENTHSDIGPDKSSIVIRHDPTDFDLSKVNLPPQKNGKVITPYGDLPIEGLRVKVDASKLSVPEGQILKVSTVEIEPKDLIDPRKEWKLGGSFVLNPSGEKNRKIIARISKQKPLHIGNKDELSSDGNPSLYKSSLYLPISGAQDGNVVIEAFDAKSGKKLSSGMYEENFLARCNDKVFLVEELPSSETTPTICDTADLFEPYLKEDIGIVTFSVPYEPGLFDYQIDGYWDADDNVLRVGVPEYRRRGKYETNALIRFHELSHAANEVMDVEVNKTLDLAYDRLKSAMRFRMPDSSSVENNYNSVMKNEPLWASLTETTYLQKIGIKDTAGHPQDHAKETFASTLNVLRTFPELFIDEYAKLQCNERQAVAHMVATVVESMQSINQDKASMQKLLPELPSVLKTLANDSANSHKADEYNALLKSVS